MPHEMPGAKSLSVVIAAWNDPALLRGCLRSLAGARQQDRIEVIVAYPADRTEFGRLILEEFTGVTVVPVDEPATVPDLRKAGLAVARGEVVAFLEDHATVGDEWPKALLDVYRMGPHQAVGGPVAQAEGHSSVDWAAYLFDYGRFMPPHAGGNVRDLSGLNMSYSRSLLESLHETLSAGVIEGPLHEELARRHIVPQIAPAAVVYQNKRYALRPTLVSVYYLGRGYAGRRVEGSRLGIRLGRAAACSLLPAVLIWRVLAVALPKRREVRHVLSSVGYLALIALSWSAGECLGYVTGFGDSDSHWR
jgi:hypothetical protein